MLVLLIKEFIFICFIIVKLKEINTSLKIIWAIKYCFYLKKVLFYLATPLNTHLLLGNQKRHSIVLRFPGQPKSPEAAETSENRVKAKASLRQLCQSV